MTTDYPWTWADSECCHYLRADAPHIDVLKGQFKWHPEHVLVLGCGDGTSMNGMARKHPGVQFTGVDMNENHIRRAQGNAPKNARYLNLKFNQLMEDDFTGFSGKPDTVILLGVAGYVDQINLIAALVAAGMFSTDDMRLIFNFPNALTWTERTIYRDAIADVGRRKDVAMRTVETIARWHPSQTVRAYGEALQASENERRHFLFAPHFKPMYDWEAEQLLARYGFSLIQSRTSALALEPITPQDMIRSDGRWQLYGREPMHDHGA